MFRGCEKTVESYLLDVDSLWSWSNNELLKGILCKYQYLLDKLHSIHFFPGSIHLSGDLVMVALEQRPWKSMEALCAGMLLEAISVGRQNSSQGEENAVSALSHLFVLLRNSV